MKEVDTTYYCDVTEEEVSSTFDLLFVDAKFGSRKTPGGMQTKDIHIGVDLIDGVSNTEIHDYVFEAFVDRHDSVVGMKADSGMHTFFFDKSHDRFGQIHELVQTAIDTN